MQERRSELSLRHVLLLVTHTFTEDLLCSWDYSMPWGYREQTLFTCRPFSVLNTRTWMRQVEGY